MRDSFLTELESHVPSPDMVAEAAIAEPPPEVNPKPYNP